MGMRLRFSRSGRAVNIGVAVVASLFSASVVLAASSALSYTPQKADQITNIDILRTQIANYYGDPTKSGTFKATSNYAREAKSVAAAGSRWLQAKAHKSAMQAIVLDVDDTTLTTWNYEVFSNWAYNPSTNATYVNDQKFPATPGMVAMVKKAVAEGYTVFFITGRPSSQYDATMGNLTSDGVGVDAGYPVPQALFTKPSDPALYPAYLTAACSGDPGGKCTTIHYKSATRAYIESMGYDIVADFGDQYSDLKGGYTDKTFKMPNPNYYLP
jgi:predicted secreted acid phosphatase